MNLLIFSFYLSSYSKFCVLSLFVCRKRVPFSTFTKEVINSLSICFSGRQVCFSPDIYPQSELFDHDSCMFIFFKKAHSFLHNSCTNFTFISEEHIFWVDYFWLTLIFQCFEYATPLCVELYSFYLQIW